MIDILLGVVLLFAFGWFFAQRNTIEWFFDLVDLGDNLKKARTWVRQQDGWPALILAVFFAVLSFACGALSWRFDLLPTWNYTRWIVSFTTITQQNQELIAMLGFAITLMPTLIELVAVGLGRDGVKMVEGLVYLFAAIDIITDWPAASGLIDGWMKEGLFQNWWAPLSFAGEYLLKASWTVMSSFGFEMLTVLFAATAVMLCLAALPDARSRR